MKKFCLFFTLVSALFMLASCTEQSTESGGGKTMIKISHHPYLHALPGHVADVEGLYDAADFDYEITMFAGGPPQNEALASDAWEVGTTGTGGAILGASGYGLKVIGFTSGDTNVTDLWVRPDHPLAASKGKIDGYPNLYGTADMWRGQTILYPSGTSVQMVVLTTLNVLGLDENDIERIDISVSQGFPAFKAGEGDILGLWSPFGFLAEKEGWIKVASAKDLNVQLPCLIIASEKAIKERPEVVQKWLEVYMEGVSRINADKNAAADLLFEFEKENGIKLSEEDSALEIASRPFPSIEEQKQLFIEDANGQSEAERILLLFTDFMIAQGRLTEEDKQRMIDNGFVDGSFIAKL